MQRRNVPVSCHVHPNRVEITLCTLPLLVP